MLLLGGTAVPPVPGPGVVTMITHPDCGPVAADRHLTHERTCPLGFALDERDVAGETIGRVTVHQITPGIRTRDYSENVVLVLSGVRQ